MITSHLHEMGALVSVFLQYIQKIFAITKSHVFSNFKDVSTILSSLLTTTNIDEYVIMLWLFRFCAIKI